MAMLPAASRMASHAHMQRKGSMCPVPSTHRVQLFARPAPAGALETRCRRHSVVAHAGKVTKITGEQLEVEIQDRDRPLIVDFYATWCGPCVLLAKELEQVAETLGDEVKILKIDVDENPVLSSQLRIEGLPTLVFIPKDGSKPALRIEGLFPAAQILEIVKDIQTP